ncbi:Na+/H+ antiporter NhaC family protein [Stomatobaculum longum]|uniref:Na+/H+ antiporter NhaC family protein n=1 Tax=Stomatobaculum longum TaxID=796942 RepID=UPI0028E69BEB|nr:Na+/H+ antiporter NhaC family protein [Stomatobaculum longum]
MAWLTLGLFAAGLLLCLFCKLSVLYALSFGLLLFSVYARRSGFSWTEILRMALRGVWKIRGILITFVLIGTMTALWRAAGTLPVVVCYAAGFIRPSVFLLMTFLLNCAVSVLTGSAFATSATMGVICAAMGRTAGISMQLTGAAVLSGAYFGDRCSPVATSALLVAELTHTNIFDNIKNMLRTALVPFLLACAVYAGLGLHAVPSGELLNLRALFARELRLHWLAILPVVVIVLLSLRRVDAKTAMAASILAAVPLAVFLQKFAPADLLRISLFGYRASDPEAAAMLNGGGIAAFVKITGIVSLSASYAELFQKTDLLVGVKALVEHFARRTSPYAAVLGTSVLSAMLACNQTLTVMLTKQLCEEVEPENSRLALGLEDSAVIIAALIPWSVAAAGPLASIGAPGSAVLLACYLYLLPLWRLMTAKQRFIGFA